MDILEHDHVIAVWFVAWEGCDWLATLLVRGSECVTEYRLRLYGPDAERDPFNDHDRKRFAQAKGPKSAAALLEKSLRRHGRDDSGPVRREGDKLTINGDYRAFAKAMLAAPWVHVKKQDAPEPTQAKGEG